MGDAKQGVANSTKVGQIARKSRISSVTDITACGRRPGPIIQTVTKAGQPPVKQSLRLSVGTQQVKGLFVAAPQIELIWTAQQPATPKT